MPFLLILFHISYSQTLPEITNSNKFQCLLKQTTLEALLQIVLCFVNHYKQLGQEIHVLLEKVSSWVFFHSLDYSTPQK